ncbi:MAG: GNAT family N-acetyltransferase [Hyphomonas sp.]|uniref:GNAT family N-acetyltransferase n=1 Tax=Hyphomonas sp. TaxID=87 RepID=UPI0035279734
MFRSRIATDEDIPAIMAVMEAAISENMKPFLSAEEIVAARETMGLDRSLIRDGTYFLIVAEDGRIAGCGGWGKRRTLYGGDQAGWRDDSLSDPAIDAARIRAMYTHPDFVRQGVGAMLLELGEAAARGAGFRAIELGSTIAGEALYRAKGYTEFHRETMTGANGLAKTVIHMRKTL